MTSTNNLVNEGGENNYGQANKIPQYVAAFSVSIGAVAAGMVLGWPSNIETDLKNGQLHDIAVSADDMGWIGSIISIGALIMCVLIGYLCDLIGRKPAMLAVTVPFLIGWLLILFAQNIAMILAGRFLTGLAAGAFCVALPLYTSEIAQKEIRGALGSFFQLFLTVGILLAYVFGSEVSMTAYNIICTVMPGVFAAAAFFQPETPVYSAIKGKDEQALQALRRLRGPSYDVDAELRDIKEQIESDRKNKVSFFQAFQSVAAKKACFICFGLMFFQQLSGVNAVIMYTSSIFQDAGTSLDPAYCTIIVGVIQTVATLVSSLVIDKLGRKVLLLISGSFMALSSFLLALFFTLKDDVKLDADTIKQLAVLPIIAMCLFIVVFSLGYGPIPWMFTSEIAPAEIKSTLASVGGAFNWFLAFLVTKFYGDLKSAISGNTFYIFTGISVIGTVFVYMVLIETKGKTLEEIQVLMRGEKPTTHRKSGIENANFSQ